MRSDEEYNLLLFLFTRLPIPNILSYNLFLQLNEMKCKLVASRISKKKTIQHILNMRVHSLSRTSLKNKTERK